VQQMVVINLLDNDWSPGNAFAMAMHASSSPSISPGVGPVGDGGPGMGALEGVDVDMPPEEIVGKIRISMFRVLVVCMS
jgi:hypothetical protein